MYMSVGIGVFLLLKWNFYFILYFRETLLGQLQVYLKTLKDDFNIRTSESSPPTGKNLPEVVNNVVWVRQLEAKVSCGLDCLSNKATLSMSVGIPLCFICEPSSYSMYDMFMYCMQFVPILN